MIFGGLSEQEIEKITTLLERNNIIFEVKEDNIIKETNEKSLKYDLRHLNSPSISTHILAIEIADSAFEQMNEALIASLMEFGITDKTPEGFLVTEEQSISDLHGKMLEGNKRLIGFENLHLIIISVVVIALIFSISFANNYFDSKKVSLSESDIRVVGSFYLRNELRSEDKDDKTNLKRKFTTGEKKVINLLIERMGLVELGNDFRSMFIDIPLNLQETTQNFIAHFSFAEAFQNEIKMLSKKEIYKLGEIEGSEIPTKLDSLSDVIDEDIEKNKADKGFPIFSPSHYNKIKKIINYIDEYDSIISFQKNMFMTASFIKNLSEEKDLSREELEIISLLSIKDYLQEEKANSRRVVDIMYYRLSEKELDLYYDFLVKMGAKTAHENYNRVFERVFYKFTDEIFKLEMNQI